MVAQKVRALRLSRRVKLTCLRCGKEWLEKPSQSHRKYCSMRCRNQAYVVAGNFPCPDCGKAIYRIPSRAHIRCRNCGQKRQGQTMSGKNPMHQPPKTVKKFSPDHCNAVECFFRSPDNVILYCRNIARFVHEHKNLFDPNDVIVKPKGGRPLSGGYSNATNGLSKIYRGYRSVWKGWMIVSNREGRERVDLIGRNWRPESESSKMENAADDRGRP